jgi:hypothetical protein
MKTKWRSVRLLLAVSLIVVSSASVNYPQDRSQRQDAPDGQTTLENIVALRITSSNGEWARATIIEGGALSVEDNATGVSYSFFPVFDKTNKKNVTMRVFQANKAVSAERLDEIGSVGLSIGSGKIIMNNSPYSIEVEAIIKRFVNSADESTKSIRVQGGDISPLLKGGNCCITCQGMTWCSNCSVSTFCGCCNTESCGGDCN